MRIRQYDNSYVGWDSRHSSFLIGGPNEKGTVKPQEVAQIIARPQVPFRGQRLMVWSGCAPQFAIHQMKIGNNVLEAHACTIPADAFSAKLDMLPLITAALEKDGLVKLELGGQVVEALGLPFQIPTAQPGMDLTIVVENISDHPQRFLAMMLGLVER